MDGNSYINLEDARYKKIKMLYDYYIKEQGMNGMIVGEVEKGRIKCI